MMPSLNRPPSSCLPPVHAGPCLQFSRPCLAAPSCRRAQSGAQSLLPAANFPSWAPSFPAPPGMPCPAQSPVPLSASHGGVYQHPASQLPASSLLHAVGTPAADFPGFLRPARKSSRSRFPAANTCRYAAAHMQQALTRTAQAGAHPMGALSAFTMRCAGNHVALKL